jgi:hypothetical protein
MQLNFQANVESKTSLCLAGAQDARNSISVFNAYALKSQWIRQVNEREVPLLREDARVDRESDIIIFRTARRVCTFYQWQFRAKCLFFTLERILWRKNIFPDRKKRRDTRSSLCYHSSPSESGWKISLCAPRASLKSVTLRRALKSLTVLYVFSSREALALYSQRAQRSAIGILSNIYINGQAAKYIREMKRIISSRWSPPLSIVAYPNSQKNRHP